MDNYIIGTCETMCPKNEILRREKGGLLHTFEIKQGYSIYRYPKAEPSLVVKEFRRSAAGCVIKANEVRPTYVLKRTIKYLIKEILSRNDVSWNFIYDFVFDRIRAIRQDLTIQNANDVNFQFILKVAVKFYLYSAYRLCEESISIFDPHINKTHLQECLKQLMKHYENNNFSFDPEIVSLYLLFNLESDEALSYVINLQSSIRFTSRIQIALRFVLSWRENNYVRISRMMNQFNVFEVCAIHMHIERIRRQVLRIMTVAYNKTSLPLDFLRGVLTANNDDEIKLTCRHYEIQVMDQTILFSKIDFNSENKIFPTSRSYFVERQLAECNVQNLILGKNY